MSEKKKIKIIVMIAAVVMAIITIVRKFEKKAKDTSYKAREMDSIPTRRMGIYEKYIKRIMDIICALAAIICFSWLYIIVAILVKVKLGSPVLFTQERPGLVGEDGKETIFKMYKFRTMTDERDENGELLPDEVRLTRFGKWLRSTSLDELPEAFNILNGTMSVVGPRPQLVRDMVFMTPEQRMRHTAKPGLSGLAQINGRNDIDWEDKLEWDLKYINHISFLGDIKIIIKTIEKAFVKKEGITEGDMATAEDFGDYLLARKNIDQEEYENKQKKAINIDGREILEERRIKNLVSIIMPSYNTGAFIEESIQCVLNQTYSNWELIIVDDCSTDNTLEILEEINDDRIIILKNDKNSGAAVSRNKALRKAKGQWVAFLDSDDLWHPEKLEKQIAFMKTNKYYFSYTNYEEIDMEGNKTGVKVTGPKKITKTGMFNYCWPGCLTVMYDAENVGLIQIADIKKNNDYAMWLKICQKADCYLLDEFLGLYRKGRSGSVSTHSTIALIGWHYKLFREVEHESALMSIINTCRNLVWGVYKKKRYVTKKNG